MLGTKLMRGALAVVLTCVGLMSLFVESASAQADTPIGEWVRIPGSSGWDRLRIQGYGSTITAVDSYSPIPPPEGVWDPFYFRVANNGDVLLSRYADNKLEYGDPLTYVVSLMSNGQLSVILTDPYEMWVYTPASTSQEQTTTTTALQPQISASGEYYNLILRYSKNCLGVQGGQATEVTCDANSQVWNLPTTPTDYFQIQMQDSNQCLSASSNTETEPFALKSCDGSADQQWQEIPSGGYFQLKNETILAQDPTNACLDARQWGQPLEQWPCKPWGNDNQIDNQLFCQTTGYTADCTPPAGVYVTGIQQNQYRDSDHPNTMHVDLSVTFSNTSGQIPSYNWFVQISGPVGGQTSERPLPIPTGTTNIPVGTWSVGHTCSDCNYSAYSVFYWHSNVRTTTHSGVGAKAFSPMYRKPQNLGVVIRANTRKTR